MNDQYLHFSEQANRKLELLYGRQKASFYRVKAGSLQLYPDRIF